MDYRESHKSKNKGEEYHRRFHENNFQSLVYKWEQKILKEISKDKVYSDYLDFACGTGRITKILAPYAENATGIDISEEMLKTARKVVADANFIHGDVTTEVIERITSYDIITCFRFFTNAQDELRESVLSWISDHTENDGYFIFNIHMNSNSPYALLARGYEFFFGKRKGFNHITLKDLSKMGLDSSYKVVKLYGYGIFPVIREQRKMHTITIKTIIAFEKLLGCIPGIKYISKYQIVVCKKI